MTHIPPKMSPFEKYTNSIQILLRHNRILGIAVFTPSKTKFRKSRSQCFFNIVAILLFTAYCTYTIYLKMTVLKEGPIFQSTELIMVVGNYIYVSSAWVLALTNREKMQQLHCKIIDFDANLEKIGGCVGYEKQRRRGLVQMVTRYALVVFVTLYVFVVRVYLRGFEAYTEVVRTVLNVYKTATCLQSVQIVLMIQQRFVELNKILGELFVKEIEQNRLKVLCDICDMHKNLELVVKHFNLVFGTQMVLFFGLTFISIAICCFYIIFGVIANRVDYFFIMGIVLFSLPFYSDMLYICVACDKTMAEVYLWKLFFQF